ncbi:hypothetical protein A3194_14205 [Candidatus Thiodiazotropha endoloripes]|nr:hypothetical protein A3194_14205 [Candidatus Thiodiazotropha endoloripes]
MPDEIKQFQVQMIGPMGVVRVNGKPQRFIEEAISRLALERRLAERMMDIDPIKGSSFYKGRFIGCWIDVQELPDPQETLELALSTIR